MNFKLKTAPVKKPLSLNEAKDHLNIELDDTDNDDYIKTLISTATDSVEQYLHRRLITQTWYLYLDGWWYEHLIIPFGKLQSVTSIKYKDTDGDSTTWSTDDYIVNSDSDPGEIVLGYEKSFPTTTLYPSNPITVEFICGYGDDGNDIKENILHAIKLRISDLYEYRETEMFTPNYAKLKTWEALLFPHKLFGGLV